MGKRSRRAGTFLGQSERGDAYSRAATSGTGQRRELWRGVYATDLRRRGVFTSTKATRACVRFGTRRPSVCRPMCWSAALAYVLSEDPGSNVQVGGLGGRTQKGPGRDRRDTNSRCHPAEALRQEFRKRCVGKPTQHQAILLHKLGLTLPRSAWRWSICSEDERKKSALKASPGPI